LLLIHASRPSLQGLEMHLLTLHKLINEFQPKTVIIDPISSLITIGNSNEVRAMLVRLMDLLKVNQINGLFTALTNQLTNDGMDLTVDAVSSLADTWIKVRNEAYSNNESIRSLFIVKSRGMGHSSLLHDFIITDKGIQLIEAKEKVNQNGNEIQRDNQRKLVTENRRNNK